MKRKVEMTVYGTACFYSCASRVGTCANSTEFILHVSSHEPKMWCESQQNVPKYPPTNGAVFERLDQVNLARTNVDIIATPYRQRTSWQS